MVAVGAVRFIMAMSPVLPLSRPAPYAPRHAARPPFPPQRLVEVARVHHSRAQVWPLGATVLVPAQQAAIAACMVPGSIVEDHVARRRDAAAGVGAGAATSLRASGACGGGGAGGVGELKRHAGTEAPLISLTLPAAEASGGGERRGAPAGGAAALAPRVAAAFGGEG